MTKAHKHPRPFNVILHLPGGDPDGVKTVEKSNWTGRGIVIPRALFGESKKREELQHTGIYVLIGPDEKTQLTKVYVGEGDPIIQRLESHARNKDFWTHLVAFTSMNKNLHKAHVKYLESKLVDLANQNKRCTLDNANVPQPPTLSEAVIAEAEGFLADVLLCLPILGYSFFEPTPETTTARLLFHLKVRGIRATGFESSKGFVVRAGSQAAKTETKSVHNYLKEMRKSMYQQGVFADMGTHYELTQNYVFNSPSTASGVLSGRNSNGRVEWKTAGGRTLKSVQDEEVSE